MTLGTRRSQYARRIAAVAPVMMVVGVLVIPVPPAAATIPGFNGKIAFTRESSSGGSTEIFAINADGFGETNLTRKARSTVSRRGRPTAGRSLSATVAISMS